MFNEPAGGKVSRSGMGTKVEYVINLLAPASENNNSRISVHSVDDLEYLKTRSSNNKCFQFSGIDQFCSSMDRMPDKHNIDLIKKTMQMHEDIFKQQVRELHRLYSVQKMLMDELQKEIKQNRKYWSPMNSSSSDINSSQFITRPNSTAQQTTCGHNFIIQNLRYDHPISTRERSGSNCSSETMRVTRGFDLERPAEEVISTGVSTMDDNQAGPSTYATTQKSNNKMGIDGSDEDSEVELTLSIGGGSSSSKKISKSYQELELDSVPSFKSERGEDCSTPTTPMSSSSATTCDQGRKRPHWLFRSLSINRT